MRANRPPAIALNRRHFFACLSAMGLGSTIMPAALTIAAQGADVVTIEVLEAAQKIAGVSFTRPEQDAILTRLNAPRGYMAGRAALRNADASTGEQAHAWRMLSHPPWWAGAWRQRMLLSYGAMRTMQKRGLLDVRV